MLSAVRPPLTQHQLSPHPPQTSEGLGIVAAQSAHMNTPPEQAETKVQHPNSAPNPHPTHTALQESESWKEDAPVLRAGQCR